MDILPNERESYGPPERGQICPYPTKHESCKMENAKKD